MFQHEHYLLKMLNCIILTKEGEKPECFSNLSKMAKAKKVNVRKYDTDRKSVV